MRKSSLGRRSSTQIPVRVPSIGGGSAQRTCSGGKKSTGSLLKPGFSQNKYRSQSEDRESYGGRPVPGSMVRSNTAGCIPSRAMATMTPKTPSQHVHSNLPTGNVRAPRHLTMSTESNRRMSSFGGKNTRKDSRPISEKAFQQAAQAKVQQYFDNYGSHVIGPGNTIRPMNTKLFIDMMDHLLKEFDSRIVIVKDNFLEQLPLLLRQFHYRSKVDKSWLMTVNTQHSWQHVIAVLSWLVETIECMKSVDPFEMMFARNFQAEDEDEEDDMIIDQEFVQYCKKTYRLTEERGIEDEVIDQMDLEFIEKQIADQHCTDEDLDVLQRAVDVVKEEVDIELQKSNQQSEVVEKLQQKRNALQIDYQNIEKFIEESKFYIETSKLKLVSLEEEIVNGKKLLEKRKHELQKLQDKVGSQEISLEDKEKMTKEKHNLSRMIAFYENGIREYENSAFKVDIDFAEDQRKLEKLIVEYNKLVAEKIIVEPRLKDVEVKFSLLSKTDDECLALVDKNLQTLKEEYKSSLNDLDLRKEESDNILWKIKQEQKETEEEITKETANIESIESELEKQQDLINAETQKYKEELARYQKATAEITDDISQINPEKLEEKKLESKKLEHDYELIKKRTHQVLEGAKALSLEMSAKAVKPITTFMNTVGEFEKKHSCY